MKKLFCLINILVVAAALAGVASSQNKNYKLDEKIDCRFSEYDLEWQQCTFIGASNDGSQPLVRTSPTHLNPKGSEQALSNWSNIRPLSEKTKLAMAALEKLQNEFAVGERVEYSSSCNSMDAKGASHTDWKAGVVLDWNPDSKQVSVRELDRYTSWVCVRHIGAAHSAANADAAPPKAANDGETNGDKAAPKTNVAGGTGLMTKEEIIGYMRTNGYANGEPKKDLQVCLDLIEEIKRRGVVEPLTYGKYDVTPIQKNNCGISEENDVIKATRFNVGVPNTLGWLAGTWNMMVIGGTVDTAPGDGYIHRQNESIARLGFITINANGTYVWKVEPEDPPAKYVKGTWRKATAEEMIFRGAAGIVLLKADKGIDWIVFKYINEFMKGDNIDVQHLNERGMMGERRIGSRK